MFSMTVSNTKQWSVWKRWLGKQTEESVLPPCLVVYWQSNRSVVSLSGTLFNFSYDISLIFLMISEGVAALSFVWLLLVPYSW